VLFNRQVKEAPLMSYTQLTREQRYQIYALRQAGNNQTEMAIIIGCHKSTISRELRRNAGRKGYRSKQAHETALSRRCLGHRTRITQATWERIELLLQLQWSPEQIHGRLRLEKQPTVSPEWIYQYIYKDKRRGGILHRHLRSQKKQRKRYAGHSRRAQIPNRTSIDQRPKIVAGKRRIGDWESDTLIGARHRGAILSCNERKSKLTLLRKLESKGALEVKREFVDLLRPIADKVFTVTVDNGKEFCEHKAIAALLKTRIYFAHPYASWERGLNENTNGLVRQYFPKKTDFSQLTHADVQRVEARLNNRPRKTLGFKTPNEVFFKQRLLLFS
jgi:IS30 family transposase